MAKPNSRRARNEDRPSVGPCPHAGQRTAGGEQWKIGRAAGYARAQANEQRGLSREDRAASRPSSGGQSHPIAKQKARLSGLLRLIPRRRRTRARSPYGGSAAPLRRLPLAGCHPLPSREQPFAAGNLPVPRTLRHAAGEKRKARSFERALVFIPRRRSTLPRSCPRSTIDAEELNFRVRNGNGCGLLAMAAGKIRQFLSISDRVTPRNHPEARKVLWSSLTGY